MDFLTDSVQAIAARVNGGEQSAREVTEHAIVQIERLNPQINAFVAWDGDRALAQADAIDARVAAGENVGPLAGIPTGVKDLEAVEGYTTSFGSAVHSGDAPAHTDSLHVERLRAAGAVIMGKTNTPEFGHKGATDNIPFGQTVNPWSPEHSPGGSSGGTAAAIASGMVPLGTGSDGGGSIRIPASLCGLSGIKPETARIPITGRAMPGSGLLSTNGPMGRTTLDSAIALDAVVGPDGRDPLSVPAKSESWTEAVLRADPPKRVIWAPTMGYAKVDAEVLASCKTAVESLEAAGTEVIELDKIFDEDPVRQWLVLWGVARFKAQGHLMGTSDWDMLSESIKPQIELGANVSGLEFAQAQDYCYELNWKLEEAFESAGYISSDPISSDSISGNPVSTDIMSTDIILCPSNAGQPPRLGQEG